MGARHNHQYKNSESKCDGVFIMYELVRLGTIEGESLGEEGIRRKKQTKRRQKKKRRKIKHHEVGHCNLYVEVSFGIVNI